MSAAAVGAGAVVAGRYRIMAPLGRGGMGSVWRAEHVELGTAVALKLMDPAIANDDASVARFKREAQAAAALRSQHVVQIFDFGVDLGTAYLAMELLEGESLRERLARTGPLSAAETSRIITETARALTKAHGADVVHRDIKPDNIFLALVEDVEVTRLLDFGVAKVTDPGLGGAPLTRTGSLVGTPQYMSPEQIEGTGVVDARADLWALAVVAFECLTGRLAFRAETFGELVLAVCARPLPVPSQVGEVPPGFDAWFARAAHRDPAARFQSARAMADSLAEGLGLAPASGQPAITPRSTGPLASTSAMGETLAAPQPAAAQNRWSGGDERAGFEVEADRETRTLRLKFWGFWGVALLTEFEPAVLAAYRVLEPLRPWVALSDTRDYPPQRPEVQALHKIAMGQAGKHGLVRAAMLVNSALSQMQTRRLFEEAGNPPNVGFFVDPAEARAWIDR